jgi:hypothetical protein
LFLGPFPDGTLPVLGYGALVDPRSPKAEVSGCAKPRNFAAGLRLDQ